MQAEMNEREKCQNIYNNNNDPPSFHIFLSSIFGGWSAFFYDDYNAESEKGKNHTMMSYKGRYCCCVIYTRKKWGI